jgi:hypothetical protein
MSSARNDDQMPLQLATDTARRLKPGTWASVRALAILAWAAGELEAE